MADVLYVGGKTFLSTRVESTYGTDPGGSDDKIQLITNVTQTMKNNMVMIYTLGGGRSYKAFVPGKFEASGTFEYEIQNGQLLRFALGTISAATTTTTNFDGTTITGTPTSALKRYCVSEADVLPSFTMQMTEQSDVSASDVKTIYTGVKINQLTIKADTENPLHATVDWLAQKPLTSVADYSAVTFTGYKDVPYMFYRGQLLMAIGTYGTTGTGTLNTMTDATQAWTVNAFQTNWVLIDSLGAAFVITANTATTITVSGTPTTGKYVVVPLSTTAGNQVVECNSVDTVLNQNLEQYWTVANNAGRGVQFLLEKSREYTLTLDLNFMNTDQLGRFYSGATAGTTPITTTDYAPFAVVVDYKTALADGDAYRAMKICYTNVTIDDIDLPVNPKDYLKQTIRAHAQNCIAFFITNETM